MYNKPQRNEYRCSRIPFVYEAAFWKFLLLKKAYEQKYTAKISIKK